MYFLLLRNKFYSVSLKNKEYLFSFKKSISSNIKYINCISEKLSSEKGKQKNAEVDLMKYNNIIYGKRDKDLCFYFITLDLSYCITLENFDENISCKLLEINLYVLIQQMEKSN